MGVSIKLPIAGTEKSRAELADEVAITRSFSGDRRSAAVESRRPGRLAFLAPDIVDSIVEGRQPANLTAEAVTRRVELPLEWRSQRTALKVQ